MSDLTIAELVERVRAGFDRDFVEKYPDALSALSELEERLEAARAGDEKYGEVAMTWRTRAEAAERERDEWHAEQQKTLSAWQKEYLRVRELEEALRFYSNERRYEIDEDGCAVDWQEYDGDPILQDGGAIARAALATASGKVDEDTLRAGFQKVWNERASGKEEE